MLKSIIQNEPFCPIFRQRESILITVFAYAKLRPAVEPLAQQSNLVGRRLTAGIALPEPSRPPRQDRRTMSFRGKPLRNPQHHRRLARAPDGQVPHADYSTRKPPAAQKPMLVKGGAQLHRSSIKQTERPQQSSNQRRRRHVFARCSMIAATRSSVAAVAPRLRSTISRAANPICARRDGLSSRSIHAALRSAAEPTSIAAPASSKAAAISRKLSIE